MTWKPNPWIATLLSLVPTPLGMLYVRRPRLAALYLLAYGSVAAMFIVFGSGLGSASFGAARASEGLFSLVCAVHTFTIARRFEPIETRPWYTRWYGLIIFPVALFTIIFLFRSFLYEPFRVPSASMYPTIQKGSFVFVDKRGQPNQGTFGFHPFRFEPTAKISRTDMIVFRTPHDPEVTYLMRVIGVPGDRVIYRNHRLTLNDESVPISFGGTAGAYQLATEIIDGHEVQIALLPNRPSPELDVVVPPDHYLVLGDSRDNARDSRFVGFIPRENIVGRVAKIFQSGEEPTRY